jgi:hypothetical protein
MVSSYDRQHGYENAREPDLIDYSEAVARQEWQAAVNAYEDGLTDVDPGPFEDWF